MKTPKVSVIVPVYGVEKYIERCARSLFEQTLGDIEYLFIDDCSLDNSIKILLKILEEYPFRKNQVVIHRMEQNSGQAAVRKWGILNATGEYVIHCDSDDWVKQDMYEIMYVEAKSGDYDITMCDFCLANEISILKECKSNINEDKFILLGDLLSGKVHSSLCTKMVRSILYNETFIYPEDNMREDLCCTIQLVYNAKSIRYLPMSMYYYYMNKFSISNAFTVDKIYNRYKQSCNNYYKILTFLQRHDLVSKYSREIVILKLLIKEELCKISNSQDGYRIWNEAFPDVSIIDTLTAKISFRMKLKIILTDLGLYFFKL